MMQRELGRLTLLAEDTNLLAVLLWHLPLRDCLSLSSVCSQLCKQVRAAIAVSLALSGRGGREAAAMPPSRAFKGVVHVTYDVGPSRGDYCSMAALLRYAADNWPYITSINLEFDWECPQVIGNPAALMGPLQTLGLMPYLTNLSLTLPRLEEVEMDTLAALTGLTRLALTSVRDPEMLAVSFEPLPDLWQLSRLAALRELALTSDTPGGYPEIPALPGALTAITILSSATVRNWLPALGACPALQQLKVVYDGVATHVNAWDLLFQMAPRLVHLTSLALQDSWGRAPLGQPLVQEPPQACFPALHTITCPSSVLQIKHPSQWRLLAACPALVALSLPLVATEAPPPDLRHLGLTRLEVALSLGWTEAGALLRHCPLVEEVEIRLLHNCYSLPEMLPLALQPLQHLQRVQIKTTDPQPQLVEVLAPSLSTTRSLDLAMPQGPDGTLPDLSACCYLTQLVWTTTPPDAAAEAEADGQDPVEPPDLEDLLWSVRGCGGLVELTLSGWTWLDARLALAAAGAHSALRLLRLQACGVLPGKDRRSSEQRLQRIRGLLRPSLVLEVEEGAVCMCSADE